MQGIAIAPTEIQEVAILVSRLQGAWDWSDTETDSLFELLEVETIEHKSVGDAFAESCRLLVTCVLNLAYAHTNNSNSSWSFVVDALRVQDRDASCDEILNTFLNRNPFCVSFVDAILGDAIWSATDGARMPEIETLGLFRLISRFIQESQQPFSEWPIPPSRGRSASVHSYVSQLTELIHADEMRETISILSQLDDIYLESALGNESAPQPGMAHWNITEFVRCRDEALILASWYLSDWPLEASLIERVMDNLRKAVPPEAPISQHPWTRLDELIMSILSSVDRHVAKVWDDASETRDVVESQVITLDLSLSGLYHTEDVPTIGAAEVLPHTSLFSDIIRFIEESGCSRLLRHRNSISLLSERLRLMRTKNDHAAAGRDVMSLAVQLDEAVLDPIQRSDDVIQLRTLIRRLLVENFGYSVIDDRVRGRSYIDCGSQVVVHRAYGSSNAPLNCILGVYRPGYLLNLPNGATEIIRPAEVDVAS